ncbi:hypothetical protein Glove_86g209 [Diversispora epigaea]|uniref:F-box domain-containing protein n=1 Tax=Diversispora epigaea TaxID=1348612 RepID=A0A397JFT6_9GLOM|nr:hypothetical protein Glove_86g209 [Diversispora epigaea]
MPPKRTSKDSEAQQLDKERPISDSLTEESADKCHNLKKIMPNLNRLQFSACPNVTDLRAIAHSCQNLEYLDVFECCQVSELGIYSDSNIKYLDISTCNFIPESIINETIHFSPKLQHLDLGFCNIFNSIIKKIARSCPNLKFLGLEWCKNISKKAIGYLNRNIHIEDYDSERSESDSEWSDEEYGLEKGTVISLLFKGD